MNYHCPLCKSSAEKFYENKYGNYLKCTHCSGIFLEKDLLPKAKDEKSRYEDHDNDVNDKGYQNFVSPISDAILKEYTPEHKGLDFGAGPGPVISKILDYKNFSIVQYDPFFHNYPDLLTTNYDYIVCCEVIEHFHSPSDEFALLETLLKPGGKLFCMTHLYDDSIDFNDWYYKNDGTHVFFYSAATLEWIKKAYGFSKLEVDDRLIIFTK